MELTRHERGAAYVEFVVAFPVVLLMFLCMVQLALVGTARLAVHHAANVGARAAIVVLPDDPRHHLGEPRASVRASSRAAAHRSRSRDLAPKGHDAAALHRFVAAGPPGSGSRQGESRSAAIRRAVVMALSPYAPPWFGGRSVLAAVDGVASRLAHGLTTYPDVALSVTYPVGEGKRQLHERTVSGDQVTVRVAYFVYCAVPVAARLVCGRRRWLSGLGNGGGRPKDPDLGGIVNAAGLRRLLHFGAHFVLLKAETTLVIQKAGYEEP